MAVGKRITAAQEKTIRRLLGEGKSCRVIAAEAKCSKGPVCRIAKQIGHDWEAHSVAAGAAAKAAYGAARRSGQILRMGDELDGIIDRYRAPTLVWSFGGKDNDYNEHSLERPDGKTLLDLSKAAYSLVATMKQLHEFDRQKDADLSDFDRFLAAMIPGVKQ